MANTKSAQKRAKQSEVKRTRNNARKTAIKTAIRKVIDAVDKHSDVNKAQELLRDVAAQLGRAKGKGTFHRNAAARKLSRLTKRVNKHTSHAQKSSTASN
jgi:small subunit ribosomal protein S20